MYNKKIYHLISWIFPYCLIENDKKRSDSLLKDL